MTDAIVFLRKTSKLSDGTLGWVCRFQPRNIVRIDINQDIAAPYSWKSIFRFTPLTKRILLILEGERSKKLTQLLTVSNHTVTSPKQSRLRQLLSLRSRNFYAEFLKNRTVPGALDITSKSDLARMAFEMT